MNFNWLKSKTFWGVVLGVVSTLIKNPHILPPSSPVGDIIQAVLPMLDVTQVGGAGLAVIGLRDAQAKNGT